MRRHCIAIGLIGILLFSASTVNAETKPYLDIGAGLSFTRYRPGTTPDRATFGGGSGQVTLGLKLKDVLGGNSLYFGYGPEFLWNKSVDTIPGVIGLPVTTSSQEFTHCRPDGDNCKKNHGEWRHTFTGGWRTHSKLWVTVAYSYGFSKWALKKKGSDAGDVAFILDSRIPDEVFVSSDSIPGTTLGDNDLKHGNSYSVGPGVIFQLGDKWGLTARGEYYRTNYGINSHQNNIRFIGGVVYRWGGF